ncbi:MAG: hypothetical protein GY874_11515, partial [Desulfobacteraceae bacterium]|nr:hypothetical protein [Desulfobacteraceae bacterium]
MKKIVDNNTVTVPDAMKCVDFTSDEIKNMALQQRIRRAAHRAKGGDKPSSISVNTSTMPSVSALAATPPTTKRKAKKVRHTSAAAHQKRKNNLVDREAKSTALKYAT